MKTIYSSNPYNWIILTISMTIILIIGVLSIFISPYLSIGAISLALMMAYLIIPRYMNLRPILEITESSLHYVPNKTKVAWNNIVDIKIDKEKTITIDFYNSQNNINTIFLEVSDYFYNAEKLFTLLSDRIDN